MRGSSHGIKIDQSDQHKLVTEWLGAGEALERLGIRSQTLYAYVSRGRVHAEADPDDPRRSRYRASDIASPNPIPARRPPIPLSLPVW